MKKNLLSRVMVMMMVLLMVVGSMAACSNSGGNSNSTEPTPTEDANNDNNDDNNNENEPADSQGNNNADTVGGKILLLSNLTDGANYDYYVAYLKMACDNLGYTMEVIYGDGANDPAGNLSQVKNAMTSDVVGLIAMQDGGINDILLEYPELYVVGFMTDMASVYDENGTSKDAAENDRFLGTIADGFVDGVKEGEVFFQVILDKGYKKVSTVTFPFFAYPQHTIAEAHLRQLVDEYNETASDDDKIEVVGEVEVLTFTSLSDSYFLESQNQDLDAVIALCAGKLFVYPVMINAIANGSISPDTKLVTRGFENDSDIIADIGDDGVIQYVEISSVESMIYPIVLLDNAIQGNQFADWKSEPIDAPRYAIDTREALEALMENSSYLSLDMSKLALSWDDAQKYFTRYNEGATLADLQALMASEDMTLKAFMQ